MKTQLNILITGGNSGVGKALAMYYAGLGASLAITGRDISRLQETAREISEISGKEPLMKALDVKDQTAMREFILEADSKMPLDIVIANAGISGDLGGGKTSEEIAKEIMATNFMGVLNTIFPAAEVMTKRKNGQIAVVSSIAGFFGLPSAPAYSASKAAVNSYCDGLRPHLKRSGIHLTLICPGFIDTPLVKENPFPMPFIMSADKAATIIASGIEKKKKLLAFPLPMKIMAILMKVMPTAMKDLMLGKIRSKELLF
jgi:short-subunit dehydrogenase